MGIFDENIKHISNNSSHYIGDLNLDMINQNLEINLNKNAMDRTFKINKLKRELIFIIGVLSFEEIVELVENSNDRSIFVIIEPNQTMFYHALNNKDLSILEGRNIALFVDELNYLSNYIQDLLTTKAVFLIENVRFYFTHYYRNSNLGITKKIIKMISSTIKYTLFSLGNSIEDSLKGLENNMLNLKYLQTSKDFSKLKGAFEGYPSILVSAGPSLDKNIEYLKKAKGKAVILAVDTIIDKLLKNGIIPDFCFSIERIDLVYEYFYEKKNIPDTVTLVAPLVIKPEIFEEFKGNIIIPMRSSVIEYNWLNEIVELEKNAFLSMGASVAHLAFGFATHIGSSTIIFIGQDLAFDQDTGYTHSSGTIYKPSETETITNNLQTEGYYGGMVKTQQIWLDFKQWFELEILKNDLHVINSTEGGAKIELTKQMPLKDAINKYCVNELSVQEVIGKIDYYQLDNNKILENYKYKIKELTNTHEMILDIEKQLLNINLEKSMNKKDLFQALEVMSGANKIVDIVYNNKILLHNLQPFIINLFQRFYKIPEKLNVDTISANLEIQKEFIMTVKFVLLKITELSEVNFSLKE